MTDRLTIAIAQINPTVGDLAGNVEKIRKARAEAAARGADLVVYPELTIAAYQPEDLVLKPAFQAAAKAAAEDLAADTADGGPGMIVGAPWAEDGKVYNAALLLDAGRIAAKRYKYDLPNYGVFDDKRVFAALKSIVDQRVLEDGRSGVDTRFLTHNIVSMGQMWSLKRVLFRGVMTLEQYIAQQQAYLEKVLAP